MFGKKDIVRHLLDAGIDPIIANSVGATCYQEMVIATTALVETKLEEIEENKPTILNSLKTGEMRDKIALLRAKGMLNEKSVMLKVSELLPEIADVTYDALNAAAGQRVDFSLVVWAEGRANYIATADRESVTKALTEMLDSWKKNGEEPPAHKFN